MSDSEREVVVAHLQSHYVDGHLTLGELDGRLGQALQSRTLDDLVSAGRGLPPVPATDAGGAPGRSAWERLSQHRSRFALAALAVGAVAQWWSG